MERKNTVSEIKNTLEEMKGRLEEQISKLEDRVVKITQAGQKKEKKKTKMNLRQLWDNIRHTSLHITEVLEGEQRKKGEENLFEEIIAENFPNLKRK